MATEKRKHKTKILNEEIFNELVRNEKQDVGDIGKIVSLNDIAEYYHKKFFESQKAVGFLESLGIKN